MRAFSVLVTRRSASLTCTTASDAKSASVTLGGTLLLASARLASYSRIRAMFGETPSLSHGRCSGWSPSTGVRNVQKGLPRRRDGWGMSLSNWLPLEIKTPISISIPAHYEPAVNTSF
jgi:hypothetical protein